MRRPLFWILLASLPLPARADCVADRDAARAALYENGDLESAHALHAAQRACLEAAHAKVAEAREFLSKGDNASAKASLLEAFRLAAEVRSDEQARAVEVMVLMTSGAAMPALRSSPRAANNPPADAGPANIPTEASNPVRPDHSSDADSHERVTLDAAHKQNWLSARARLRAAVATARAKKDAKAEERIQGELDEAERECLKNAARQLQEAKVYENAGDSAEALRAIDLALLYADLPNSREHASAVELRKLIQRNTETVP